MNLDGPLCCHTDGKGYTLKNGANTVYSTSIGYYDGDGITSAKSARVETITNGDETLTYTYDDRGYITRVEKDANNYSEYRYDALGQLMRENYKWGFISYTMVYAYDVGGNIAQKDKYEFVAGDGDVVTLIDSIAYTYDATWKDKLASYDGDSITYDDIGNPLNDGTWTYTWTQGRKLSAISGGMTSASYKYNNSGIRTQKSVGGVTTVFNLAGDNITWQKTGTGTPIYFIYDSAGKLWGLNYEGNTYFYVRNAQGDIIKIVDNTGAVVVEYAYDAWGNLLMTSDSSGVSLSTVNPFRYRGYYYDVETGLYYLNARYYNPRWRRFINADSLIGQKGKLLSHNVFAYCANAPVMASDPSGNFWYYGNVQLSNSTSFKDGENTYKINSACTVLRNIRKHCPTSQIPDVDRALDIVKSGNCSIIMTTETIGDDNKLDAILKVKAGDIMVQLIITAVATAISPPIGIEAWEAFGFSVVGSAGYDIATLPNVENGTYTNYLIDAYTDTYTETIINFNVRSGHNFGDNQNAYDYFHIGDYLYIPYCYGY